MSYPSRLFAIIKSLLMNQLNIIICAVFALWLYLLKIAVFAKDDGVRFSVKCTLTSR